MNILIRLIFTLFLFCSSLIPAYGGLDFGTLKAVPISVISISPKDSSDVPVQFGGSVKLIAETFPEGESVIWSVEPEPGKNGEQANADIDDSGNLKPTGDSGSGWVKVTASIDGGGQKQARVYIGCSTCASDSNSCDIYAGVGFAEVHSINFRISLGTAEEGLPAGDIYIYAKEPNHDLATPKALQVSTLSKNVETLYVDEMLRQVITPQAIVSILQLKKNYYEIFFYEKGAPGEFVEGLFIPAPIAVPETLWQIEGTNPEEEFKDLSITELRQGKETRFLYSYDKDENEWSLASGDGLKLESSKEYIDEAGNRIVRNTITGSDGEIVNVTEETYHEFEWDEELIKYTVDPDNVNLETITSYYEESGAGYGRLKSKVHQDGSWEKFVYDSNDRIIKTIRPWLNSEIDDPENQHQVIVNDYSTLKGDTDLERDDHKARTTTELIGGVATSKSFNVFTTDKNGGRVEISEQCNSQQCAFGDTSNLRTITAYYPEEKDLYQSEKLKSVLQADGRVTTYTYETGMFTPSYDPEKAKFTPGEGKAIRKSVIHGTKEHPNGIAFKTTRETSITDWLGNIVMSETYVITVKQNSSERINWVYNSYSAMGRLIETYHSNQTRTENSWSCCGKASTTNVDGITTSYSYDDLKRVTQQVNEATGIITQHTYDAMGRRLGSTIKNKELASTTSSTYDLAGRVREAIDPTGLVTTYYYDKTVSAVIRPGDKDETTERYLDGKIKSVTGSSVIDRFYEYGINDDGTSWTKVNIARADSPRYEKTTRDLLGRVTKVEKPGFQGLEISESFYNSKGQLVKTSTTGLVDSLYIYDELGNQTYSGIDVDNNGKLVLASIDRIQGQESLFAKEDGSWWRQQTQKTFAMANDDSATTLATNRTRLSDWKDQTVSENIQIDLLGNKTISLEKLDRYNIERARVTKYPDSEIEAVQIYKNNQLVSSQSKTGVVQTFSYDLLGRRIAVTDQRTGTAFTKYNDKHQVESITDAAGNTTRFNYDDTTGQKTAQTSPANKVTRFKYNPFNQLTHTWGDVPYPVSYDFNEYGEMVSMFTYRGGVEWSGEFWPAAIQGDKTSWIYDEATGLLIEKKDAQENSVTYSYAVAGKLNTRKWARGVETQYTYLNTGELAKVDYSDSTPDITFKYDRIGRKVTVTDVLGERKFKYDDHLRLASETHADNSVIQRDYDQLGRNTGFSFNDFYQTKYGYDNVGRFSSIGWKTNFGSNEVAYSYLVGSDLLLGFQSTNGVSTSFNYEPHRNLKTDISNKVNDSLISLYEYQYDRLGRRTNVKNSGSAFSQNTFNLYGYNDRNELQDTQRFLGNDLTDQTKQIKDQERFYNYDPIGNRLFSNESNTKLDYTTNSLNQYKAIKTITSQQLDYDVDGNLTGNKQDTVYTKYVYNAENRLIFIEPQTPVQGSTKSSYVYDYMGRRIGKKIYEFSTGNWQQQNDTQFVYDGWNLVKEIDKVKNTESHYMWGLDLSQSVQGAGGIGGLLARIDSDSQYNYFYDGNGNVGQLVNGKSIVASYEYDPFGKLVKAEGALAETNPFRFSTKYFDDESKLYYYGYRFYAAELGRWINRDPIQEDGGINLYGFVGNDGVNVVDLLGLAYGLHLTKNEAEQLACAIDKYLIGASTANALVLWGEKDMGLTISFLKRFLNKDGGTVTLSYDTIKDDPGFVGAYSAYNPTSSNPNKRARRALHGKETYSEGYQFRDNDLAHSIGGANLKYTKSAEGEITGAIRDNYTFLDNPHPNLGVHFTSDGTGGGTPLLDAFGIFCCWKGGSYITDIWMGDLEKHGFAKKFEVHVDWIVKKSSE